MVKKMCQERPKYWDRYLQAVLFVYRDVPQASIRFSPFELLYGRTVRGPMQVLNKLWTGNEMSGVRNTYQYVLDLRNHLKETRMLVREILHEANREQKHHYDKSSKNCQFEVGHKLLVLLPILSTTNALKRRSGEDLT